MPEKQDRTDDRVEKLSALWCVAMHDSLMWPIHGQYQCRTCGRHYLVPWAGERPAGMSLPATRVPSFRSALLPIVVLLTLVAAPALRAADARVAASNAQAATVFERYIAGLKGIRPWNPATIEIEAFLPKLKKEAHLRAVRRWLPIGKPEYQVLETAGDETVKHRVILRYLTAERQAAELPASTVAITPANYKFHYKGVVSTGGNLSYVFQITPRMKRQGLIKGELWLDGETGASVRQSGRLLKNPSIFLKRVDITRTVTLRDGITEARVTHVRIAARLFGAAELTILERPYTTSEEASLQTSAAR